jgi:hypothetical protein
MMSISKLVSLRHYRHAPQTGREPDWSESVQAAPCDAGEHFGAGLPFCNGLGYLDRCVAATDHVIALPCPSAASHERVEAVAACAANRCEDSIYARRFRAEIMLVVRSLPRFVFKRTSP